LPKPYQISKRKAVAQFLAKVKEQQPVIQMILPLVEVVAQLQQGMREFVVRVVKQAIEEVMAEEVRLRVGRPNQADPQRAVTRWGSQPGYCVIQGQKVHVQRPRVRDKFKREVPLGSYELLQRASLLEEAIWDKMMRQVSTRKYSELLEEFAGSYGITRSTISGHFIEASRQKLQLLLSRPLSSLSLCAVLIDGKTVKQEQLIAVMGVTTEGKKMILGLRQGSTENTTVVKALLDDLEQRGVDFSHVRLYVLDGGKALKAAVLRKAGLAALLQRCQVHKVRNVIGHLPESYGHAVRAKMEAAYRMQDYIEARTALRHLQRELEARNPSAAKSLEEGLEETLTVHRLRVAHLLRQSLASTNLIESAFSIVEETCRNVKRWQDGDQRLRWIASALLYAESRFNRLHGHQQIHFLVKEMELLGLRQGQSKIRPAGVA